MFFVMSQFLRKLFITLIEKKNTSYFMCLRNVEGKVLKKSHLCRVVFLPFREKKINSENKNTDFQFASFPERTCYENGNNRKSHRKVIKFEDG